MTGESLQITNEGNENVKTAFEAVVSTWMCKVYRLNSSYDQYDTENSGIDAF